MPRRRDRHDDSGEYERPRRASGFPVWAVVLVVVAPIVICCGGGVAFVALMGRTAAVAVKAQQEMRERATVQIEPGQPHQIGDLTVTVESCIERYVTGWTVTGRLMNSDHPHAIVLIKLRNSNPNKNANPKGQSGYAKVVDDLGNEMKAELMTDILPLAVRVGQEAPQIGPNEMLELRSDQEGADAIVLPRSVPAAQWVTVRLDGRRYDSPGDIVVKLPIKKSR